MDLESDSSQPQAMGKELQTCLILHIDNADRNKNLEADMEPDLNLYLEPDLEPDIKCDLERQLSPVGSPSFFDSTPSIETELRSSCIEADAPFVTPAVKVESCTDSEEEFGREVAEWQMPSSCPGDDNACKDRKEISRDDKDNEEFDNEDNQCFDSEYTIVGGSKPSEQELLVRSWNVGLTALLQNMTPKVDELNANARWKTSNQKQTRYEMNHLIAEQTELRAERAELRAERVYWRVEREQLRTEREQLRTEREQLRNGQEHLWTEQERLRTEREQLRTEQEQLRTELKQLKAEKELLVADGEWLNAEQKQLRVVQEQLTVEQQQLRAAQEQLMAEQEVLKVKQEQWRTEQEPYATEQQVPSPEQGWPKDGEELPRARQEQPVRLQLIEKEGKIKRQTNTIHKSQSGCEHIASTSDLYTHSSAPKRVPPAKKRKFKTSRASRNGLSVTDWLKQGMTTRSALKRRFRSQCQMSSI